MTTTVMILYYYYIIQCYCLGSAFPVAMQTTPPGRDSFSAVPPHVFPIHVMRLLMTTEPTSCFYHLWIMTPKNYLTSVALQSIAGASTGTIEREILTSLQH